MHPNISKSVDPAKGPKMSPTPKDASNIPSKVSLCSGYLFVMMAYMVVYVIATAVPYKNRRKRARYSTESADCIDPIIPKSTKSTPMSVRPLKSILEYPTYSRHLPTGGEKMITAIE